MYLRSLEMQGFKSFPDKTKLSFTKGISAVVGPNGSGKSNIGDAMRWVLGEQSSKSLRGKTMEDVIFSGTLHRPKAGFAQVILTIDNSDGALKDRPEIVSVSRKLYRNGDSEYKINGQSVRLREISEMFMDTGLGRDGYSIIGQGKIDEIVSSKAADRRQIFDEAAGISKFRSRREETEKKLAAAEENMNRLTDILSELESRVEPLKKQCEKAKRFRELDTERAALEISLWVQRLTELMDMQKEYGERLSLLKQQYEEKTQELDRLEEDIEEGFAKAAQEGERAASLREQIHEIELGSTQAAAKTAVLENDIEHLKGQIDALRESVEQSKSSGYFLRTQLDERESERERLCAERERLAAEIARTEGEMTGSADKIQAAESEIERLGSEAGSLYLERSNAEFRLESAKNAQSAAEQALADLAADEKEREERRRLYEGENKRLEQKLAEVENRTHELQNRIAGFEKLCATRSDKLAAAEEELQQCDKSLQEASQRLSILRDIENAMEGFAYSVKFIMKCTQQGRISGVCGTIAQLISVEDKYSACIETALGAALQNVVVENEEAAKRAIKLLQENKAGRATFLPLTSVKGRELSERPDGERGYIAAASELVRCEERYMGVIKNLLGRVAVAEDIDCAADIARRHGYRFRIVTLDGQVVNAGGSYTGGSLSKSAGLLTRKNEISELEKRVEEQRGRLAERRSRREKLSQEYQSLAAQLAGQREELTELAAESMKAALERKNICQTIEQLQSDSDKLAENIQKNTEQLQAAKDAAQSAAAELTRLAERITHCERELEKSRGENAEAAKQREQMSQRLSEMKITEAEQAKDIKACEMSIEQINESIAQGSGDEERLAEQIADCGERIAQKRRAIESISRSAEGSQQRVQGLEEEIKLAQQAQYMQNAAAEKLRAEQRVRMEERESLAGEITRIKERDGTVKAEFDKLCARLWDEHGLTRSEAQESASPPEDMSAARIRLAELKSQIKSLGHVNLGAIEEYAEVSERYEFMSAQLEDVSRSKAELMGLIDSLTENMRSIFTESFEQIGRHFSQIFTELFGGGKGSLTLTDPDNVLESGIEINVAPPGKVIKNLMSLSGGEKAFIAVCIYFAILAVRPSPFCLLDEIEAALDDVNVSKYASYLRKFTDTTQFIAITHRRGTMEEADVLYGVTMQEDGISKLLKMEN